MDPNNINLHESKHEDGDDAGELLEDCWFFGNLLQTKSKSSRTMLRSLSDPCSSSSFPGKSYDETYESIKKANPTAAREIRRPMIRKTSSSSSSSSSKNSLARAPSLPTSLEITRDDHRREFHDDEEMEFSMGKLIRQASLTRPPRRNNIIAANKRSSLTRQKSRRKPETESVKSEVKPHHQLKTQRSLMKDFDIEQELQGFKELGFDSDDRSELSSISAPPVPRWGGKRSKEDMKAQIKFWARAVASNVRQEC